MFRRCVLVFSTLLLAGGVALADFRWANPQSGNWFNFANWDPPGIPGPLDNVVIDQNGTYTVQLDGDAEILSLTIGAATGVQTLNANGHRITIANASSVSQGGVLNLNPDPGGFSGPELIDGTGNLSAGNNGKIEWRHGSIKGSGALIVATGGRLLIDNADPERFLHRDFTNAGTVEMKSAPILCNDAGVVVTNTGTMDLQSNAAGFSQGPCLGGSTANVTIHNTGLIMKTAGTGSSLLGAGGLVLNNTGSGTIRAELGTLALGSGTSTGRFDALTEATLDFVEGTHTINNGAAVTGSGTIRISGTTVVTNTPLSIPKAVVTTGGTLDSSSPTTITTTFTWTGGIIKGVASLVLGPSSTTTITTDTPGGATLQGRTVVNNGQVTWTGNQPLKFLDGARFENNGSFNIGSNVLLEMAGTPASRFVNNFGGFLRKIAGTGTTTIDVDLESLGQVQALIGTLALQNGTAGGSFDAAAGTLIQFAGNSYILTDGATLNGSGTFRLTGQAAVEGSVTANRFEVVGGTLQGGGALTVTGNLLVSNGATMRGAGTTTVATGATATIDTSAAAVTFDGRTLANNGTTTWTGAGANNLRLQAILTNAGTFGVQTDGTVQGPGSIFNSGTFRKSGSAGTSTFADIVFNNSGTTRVESGTISLVGLSDYFQAAGSTVLAGGAFNSGSNPLRIQGGSLSGAGSITGSVTNGGTVSPGTSPGTIAINGDYAQTAGGTLRIELGGPTAESVDHLNITGNASLNGTLNVTRISPFEPNLGDSFEVMTFGSRAGDFSSVTGSAGPAKGFRTNFSPTSLTVEVIQASAAGDLNSDGSVNGADVAFLARFVFGGGPAPTVSADVNGDDIVDVRDVFYLVNFIFAGGPGPVA